LSFPVPAASARARACARRRSDGRTQTSVTPQAGPGAAARARACARHSFSDTTVTGRPLAWARIVSSTARAVSRDVRHGTLYSTAARRMRKPLLAGTRPRVGVLMSKSTAPD
jgi:hypothetical protein